MEKYTMSTYKFNITKRFIVQATDSSHQAPSAETFDDSAKEIAAQQDIDVKIYLDDVEKHSVTLTDAGATLQFDADIAAGEHTIKICAPKDPIQSTDICVDKFIVGDTTAVASQYDFNNVIFGTASTLRQKLSSHNVRHHDYVWYGRMVNNDSSLNLDGIFYRPCIVSDHLGEWHFEFTKTASGHIWTTQTGDTTDILYDSTAQHTYRFVDANDIAAVDAAYDTRLDTDVEVSDWQSDSTDSSAIDSSQYRKQWEIDVSPWQGPGTYQLDSDNILQLVSDSIDHAGEDQTNVVILTLSEFRDFVKQNWYHSNYTVTPITVS